MRKDALETEKRLRKLLAPRLNRLGSFKAGDAWVLCGGYSGYGTITKYTRAFMEEMITSGAAVKSHNNGRWDIVKENAFKQEVGRGVFGPKTTWINIKVRRPEPGDRVLIVIDYTKYGRERRVEIASVHFTLTPRPYGGPNSLVGMGNLTGLYFAIPAVIRLEDVILWQPIPEIF